MDHCFYIAKRTVKPAFRNHSPGGFWVLPPAPSVFVSGNAQKYQGKMYFWPIVSDITFEGGSERRKLGDDSLSLMLSISWF